jgi:ABC-2 type transport system ATP-binding protein
MLTIENFIKEYNGVLALQIPSLQLGKGIYWIKGKNGSGKTTLFRCIAGLLPYKGNIVMNETINGRTQPQLYRMLINFGEAEPLFPDFLTAKDLITFVGAAKKSTDTQTENLIATFGIGDFYHKPCGTYSSGMLKKLSLALAFLGTPALIILDEPLITLDDQTVDKVYTLINEYHTAGVSFLLSSHQNFGFSSLPIEAAYLVAQQSIQLLHEI